MSRNENSLGRFVERLNGRLMESASQPKFAPTYENSFFEFPYGINFTAKCLRGVAYTHEDGAKLEILASLMSNLFLHREICEKNGAFSGGARYSAEGGLFSFYSSLDPSPKKTLKTYQDSVHWVLSRKEFSEQELAESKLSIFQTIDAPISTGEEGMVVFSYGITDEMCQVHREQLLRVTSADVREVADRYLLDQKYSHCVIGDKE
ncbi:Mitochondrial presequence protease [Dissophora globulifera]|nr:Mitochondrial presequence protease [Dissophora globulifera]